MPKKNKAKKARKSNADVVVGWQTLTDFIRDEIYGAGMKEAGEISIKGKNVICIPAEDVEEMSNRIAKRCWVGH